MKDHIYISIASALLILLSIVLTGCSGEENGKQDVVYYCPMHPEVVSNKPGVCPICHMDLVLRDEGGDDLAEHLDQGLNLSDSKLTLANISTVQVKTGKINESVSAYSYLDFTEQSRKYITARFNGRVEKLYTDKTGEYVKAGDALFEVYSPELIQAQNEFLLSLNKSGESRNYLSGRDNITNMNEAVRQKLLLMGVTQTQLKNLEASGDINMTLTYYSPFSGIVIDKKIQEGMYFNEGALIYEVADLSNLWNIAEVYEADLGAVKEGGIVTLKLDAYPSEEFKGKVELIYPVINSQSRTVKVRSVIPNKGNKLKPNMYGRAIFETEGKTGLLIDEDAVLFTGGKNIVWVQKEKGKFEPREVKLGRKINNKYEVLSGVNEGEFVASSGGFLLDSESQLRSGSSGAHNHQELLEEEPMQNQEQQKNNHDGHSSSKESLSTSKSIIWNTVCPVIGGKVDPQVKTVFYKNRTIGFCCPGCDEDFIKDPEKYLSNLNEDGTKYISTN